MVFSRIAIFIARIMCQTGNWIIASSLEVQNAYRI